MQILYHNAPTPTSKSEPTVLHVISGADSGGAKTHVLSLLSEYSKTGRARLLCLGDGPLFSGALRAGIPAEVLTGSFPRQLSAARAILRAGGIDLLHCHGARANLIGALLGGRVPTVSTVHSDHRLDYLGRPLAGAVYGGLNAWALRRMDALVCVSEVMAQLYRYRGYPRVFAIYNGIDFSKPLSAPTMTRRADTVTVGTAARLDPVKDLPTLLRGFAAAAEREPRLQLKIAGTGREAGRLRVLADKLGVADRVQLLGWVEDMDGFYASLDVVALTSLSETFPYALLMAARYALPVVSTDVGGVGALVENGAGGFLFPSGDDASLAEALVRLAGDAALRRKMGQALFRRGREDFSLERMAARQREIYRAILTRITEKGEQI